MYYVIDENNNKKEALDKEGFLAVLQQAIDEGTLSGIITNAGVVSKLKCCVSGETTDVAFVTQAKFNELDNQGLINAHTYYFILDDNTDETINAQLEAFNSSVNGLTETVNSLNTKANTNANNIGILNSIVKSRLILSDSHVITTSDITRLSNAYRVDVYLNSTEQYFNVQYATTNGGQNVYFTLKKSGSETSVTITLNQAMRSDVTIVIWGNVTEVIE